jgi:hypothetical protein
VHQIVHVGVQLEYALNRLGRAGPDRDVGLHQVVFFGGAVKAVEGVAINQGVADTAVDGGEKAPVVSLVVADLHRPGRENHYTLAIVDLDPDHGTVLHQALDRPGQLGRQWRVAGSMSRKSLAGGEVFKQFRLDGIHGRTCQRQVALLGQLDDALNCHLPIKPGQQDGRGKDCSEACDRVIAQQLEHEEPMYLIRVSPDKISMSSRLIMASAVCDSR